MAPVPLQAAVVGAGPAGMAAAAELARAGVAVHLYDENAPTGRPADGVTLHGGAVVWGIFEGRTLAVWEAGRTALVRPGVLVLATGAHERPVPLPGWTLPGVATSGADVLAGQRVVVAGSGSFLSNTYLGNGGNLALGLNMVNWLAGSDSLVSVPPRVVADASLDIDQVTLHLIAFSFLLALPVAFIATGITVWWRRRRAI